METHKRKCDECNKVLKGKNIIGIKGQDIAWMCGKAWCDMKCADTYFNKHKNKLVSQLRGLSFMK